MAPGERRALVSLLGLALAGQAVRHLATGPGEPPGQVQLLATLPPGSPLAQRDSALRRGRPLEPGEAIDINSASAAELARLPKVGLGLAKTIVAYRQQHGAFSSLEGLDRVPGIGPALLQAVGSQVSFGAMGRALPGPSPSAAPVPLAGPTAPLDLNSATAPQLDSLPGVGPAKAAAILQYREEHGPFQSIDELARVRGFGPAAVSRLRDRLTMR